MKGEEKYVAGIDFTRLPPQAKPMLIALGQYQNGEPINQLCPDCGGTIQVDSKTTDAWAISCPCGKCNDTMRGL